MKRYIVPILFQQLFKNTKLDLIQAVLLHLQHFRTNGWLEMDYDARQPPDRYRTQDLSQRDRQKLLPLCSFRDTQYLQKVEETGQPNIETLMQNNLDVY